MEYRNLGMTGLNVSRLIFGGAHIGNVLDESATRRLVHAAWDIGINTFYAADMHDAGNAQKIIGAILKERRADVVIMTKLGYPASTSSRPPNGGGLPEPHGLSKGHLVRVLEASLTRLQTDYVDVCSVSFWDSETPIEETLEALDQFIRDGKVRYIGCSGFAAWQLYRALWVSDVNGLAPLRSFQSELNILNRFPEREQLPACKAGGVGFLAFNSLCGNLLTGRGDLRTLSHMAGPMRQMHLDEYASSENLERIQRLKRLAADSDRNPGELAQGWVLSKDAVTALLIGPNEPDEFGPTINAVDHPLSDDELRAVEEIAVKAPPSGMSRSPR